MTPRIEAQWAKEMILDFIDQGFVRYRAQALSLSHDEDEAIRKERNRIAKRFKLPEKTFTEMRHTKVED